MSNGYVTGFIGGTPGAVLLRLVVVSFIVGLILAMFGFDPETIYESFQRAVRRLIEFGLTDFRQVGRILLTGAMVVLPAWLMVSVVAPVAPELLSVIVPAMPESEVRALLPPMVRLFPLRSTVPALAVRPPAPRAKALPNCSVPLLI